MLLSKAKCYVTYPTNMMSVITAIFKKNFVVNTVKLGTIPMFYNYLQ